MKQKMTARDIMVQSVRTVAAGVDLKEAVAIMDKEGFGQLPVVENGRPVAMLTERDLRKALLDNRQSLPVKELASPLPEVVQPETLISRVLALLQEQESLLVLDEAGAIAGIITFWDVLQLARPHLLVKEVELLLREVTADRCRETYGQNWWDALPEHLTERAEEEHRRDGVRGEKATGEHMLGHTSFWNLNQIFISVSPDVRGDQIEALDNARVMRNETAHYYVLTPEEHAYLTEHCHALIDWLSALRTD